MVVWDLIVPDLKFIFILYPKPRIGFTNYTKNIKQNNYCTFGYEKNVLCFHPDHVIHFLYSEE